MPKRTLTADQVARLEARHSDERARIRTAAANLIDTSPNRPTIDDLRVAAGLPERWVLTTRHIDLKDDYLNAIEAKWGRESKSVSTQQKKYNELKVKYDRLKARNEELEEIVNVYALAIEELRMQVNRKNRPPLRAVPE